MLVLLLTSRHPLRLSAGSTGIFGIFLIAVFCFAMVSSYFRGGSPSWILTICQFQHSVHQSSKLGTSLLFGRVSNVHGYKPEGMMDSAPDSHVEAWSRLQRFAGK